MASYIDYRSAINDAPSILAVILGIFGVTIIGAVLLALAAIAIALAVVVTPLYLIYRVAFRSW
jgi:hypothetical protein